MSSYWCRRWVSIRGHGRRRCYRTSEYGEDYCWQHRDEDREETD